MVYAIIIILIQGGESTREEMCLSFPLYYPYLSEEQNLDYCLSQPISEAYDSFISHFSLVCKSIANAIIIHKEMFIDGMTCRLNPEASALFDESPLVDGLNAIAWTSEEGRYLEDSILSGPIVAFCFSATPDVSHHAVFTAYFSTI